MTQAAKTAAIAISAGAYQTKSTKAWAANAARLAAIAPAHTLACVGTEALIPPAHHDAQTTMPVNTRRETDDAGFEQNLQIAALGVVGSCRCR